MPEKLPAGEDLVVSRGTGDPMEAGAELEVRQPGAVVERASKGHLERGHVKHRLIRELALDEKRRVVLAEEYGVSTTAINNFRRKYIREIEDVRNNVADEFASTWVAKKGARLAEYQDAAEKMIDGNSPRHAEVLVTILKSVAEELGQLPAKTQVNISNENVTYEIVGINPEDI